MTMTTSGTRTEMATGVRPRGHSHVADPLRGVRRRTGLAALVGRLDSWRIWIPTAVVFLAFFSVFFASSAPFAIPVVEEACGQLPLDVRTFSTSDEVGSFLDTCGASGRDAYRTMQLADLFYPAVFGLFMASSLSMVLRRLFPWRPPVAAAGAVLALMGTGFDYLENVFAWRALAAFPESAATNGLLGAASAAKNVSFWLAGLIILSGLVALVVRTAARWLVGRNSAPLGASDATSQ